VPAALHAALVLAGALAIDLALGEHPARPQPRRLDGADDRLAGAAGAHGGPGRQH
jgi:hypothetical protein